MESRTLQPQIDRMGDVGETPLLDMVVRRISEEVADVLKVDRRNVEQHLGACLSDEVIKMGGDGALAAAAGFDVEPKDTAALQYHLRDALDRLDERRDTRKHRPWSASRTQRPANIQQSSRVRTTPRSTLCRPGEFSQLARSVSPARASRGSRTQQHTGQSPRSSTRPLDKSRPMDTGRDLFPEGAMVYRRGGGYSATPPRDRPVRSPHQTLLEQQLKVYEQECEPADQAPAPRKLNERQWESVVTRLYGNPQAKGVELQAAAENSSVKPTTKKMKHWEVEAAVNRLYQPPQKEQTEDWVMQQRVEILGKELRSMRAKPQISRTSERMARGNRHIVERVNDVILDRERKMQELIRTVEGGENPNANHMPNISPRARDKTRGYDDLMKWATNRAERIKQKEEALQVEEISSTFQPVIDQNSSMIATQRFAQEGLAAEAAERLYSQRTLPTAEQRMQAQIIHGEDFRHTYFSNN